MIRKILFLFVLCLPSVCFGQRFNVVSDSSLYPIAGTQATIPLDINANQAILIYRSEPSYAVSSSRVITDVTIVPSLTLNRDYHNSGGGYYTSHGEEYSLNYYVINSSTIFTRTGSFTSSVLDSIQSILASKGLGTVEQRAAYIASFKLSGVSIIDPSSIMGSIVSMFGPWANIGIGIAIALFGIDLGTRKSKKIAGQAAKEARAAERREINKEIRQDPIAAQFRTHLGNLSSVIRDTYGLHGTDSRTRREARALFEQAAKDYAAYKKYRGWTS